MSKIVYSIFYLISLLPLFILYGIADFFYVILFYVIGYRKAVVLKNLQTAFPTKQVAELKAIRRKFFRDFMHTWIETIKLLSISPKSLGNMIAGDYQLFYQLQKNHPQITILSGHFMNWELCNLCVPISQPYPLLIAYTEISNDPLNHLFLKFRSRFGTTMLKAGQLHRALIPFRNKPYALGLTADQNPALPLSGAWLPFFGVPTPFLSGPEKMASINKGPVVFIWLEKIKTGKYVFKTELITESPATLAKNEITRKFVRLLEEKITQHPANYLWTHKRWKFVWKPEYAPLWVGEQAVPNLE